MTSSKLRLPVKTSMMFFSSVLEAYIPSIANEPFVVDKIACGDIIYSTFLFQMIVLSLLYPFWRRYANVFCLACLMQIWPQIIIIKLIAHATAIEADVVPVRCVV